MFRNSITRSLAQVLVSSSSSPMVDSSAILASTSRLNSDYSESGFKPLDMFTEEEEMIRETVQRFANEVIQPKVREMDENEQMDPVIIKGLFEQGLMGIETSAAHGGSESSFTSAIIAIEELAKVDPPSLSSLGPFVYQNRFGSDAFALQTRAKKVGDDWVLNGTKMWITNSYEADIFLIFANVRCRPSKGYKGITCFLATKDMGIQIAKKEQKLGIRASSTCTLNFDDLKIPSENVIGGEGKGYKIAIEILNEGRIGIAAKCLASPWCFFPLCPYTYTVPNSPNRGHIPINGPFLRFSRNPYRNSQTSNVQCSAPERTWSPICQEAAMAKWWSSKVAQEVSGDAIEWMGEWALRGRREQRSIGGIQKLGDL
ncbi:acyl-CoA dehydrogenase/oxidase [Rhodocollybia butyracea]|uniref:Acyl-CoA dehydrogenase/oxidase n=1 Tax=Rhodocollybia butyracea TaxID=206335 RepID=A0A9P5P8R7_9AGAR|nr:acyl-CoA dehydrogenase/oxidase [Rhodocollybia butyracea]